MAAAQEHLPTENFDVAANAELRIEVGEKTCFITITAGEAEIFGAVLQTHRRIELRQAKLAIFTYGGCAVRLEGFPAEPAYVSDETPMHAYLNAAYIINNRRKAARDVKPGPVVAIVGPHDCGKTSVATILLNYAIRSGWNPLLVETDVRHSMISVPGAISAVQVEMPIEPDEGLLVDAPVCLFYAHTDPAYNTELYKAQISRMAALCQERDRAYQGKYSNLAAGTIVDTMGWVEGTGREVHAHACRAFNASIVLVIGDDKLHSALQATFQGSSDVDIVKLPKSGGTVQRGRDAHKHARDLAIKQYFVGRTGEMAPALQQVKLSTMKVFKVPGSMAAGAGLLPASMAASVNPTRLTPVDLTTEHVGSLLAVCYTEDSAQLAVTNVAGFVWVQQIDKSDDSVTLMCPHGTAPPSHCYIVGSIRRSLDLMQL